MSSVIEQTLAGPANTKTPAKVRSSRPRRGVHIRILLPRLVFLIICRVELQLATNKPHAPAVRIRPTGPFVQSPLDAYQINNLQHLVTHMQYKELARLYVSHMTLDEELGQLFMVQSYDQSYSPSLEYMITQLHAGGVVMYAFQIQTFDHTIHDFAEMQKNANIPLLISIDEEGGVVERVQNIFGHRQGALEIYQTDIINLAIQTVNRITHDLQSLGI